MTIRLMNKRYYSCLKSLKSENFVLNATIDKIGLSRKIISLKKNKTIRKSSYTLFKKISLALDCITNLGDKFFSYSIFIASFIIGSFLIYGAYIFYQAMTLNIKISGYPTITLLIILFGILNLIFAILNLILSSRIKNNSDNNNIFVSKVIH